MTSIKINHLTFAYEGSYDNIFTDLNAQIDTSWKLGLVGRNGLSLIHISRPRHRAAQSPARWHQRVAKYGRYAKRSHLYSSSVPSHLTKIFLIRFFSIYYLITFFNKLSAPILLCCYPF